MGQQIKTGKPEVDYSRLRPKRRADFVQEEKARAAKDHAEVGQQGNIRQNTHNQGYQQDR